MPSTQVNELLRRGIAAAKAGHKEQARQVLLSVIELDDQVELAWLWLSGVVDSLADRRICLENVLTINPDNAKAQAGLRWLDRRQSPDSLQPPSTGALPQEHGSEQAPPLSCKKVPIRSSPRPRGRCLRNRA